LLATGFVLEPAPPIFNIGNLMKAILALEDGSVFHGTGFGAESVGLRRGVLQHFDDRLQEILTDPSYKGRSSR